MSVIRLTFMCVFSFAAGVLVRDVRQDWYDAEKKAELGHMAYSCSGYLVADKAGNHECRALMPRLEIVAPFKADPLKLKRREIRRAIGG